MTDVGLVGMGVIGRIYAVNLLKAYQQIRVYDIDPGKAGALADGGARPVEMARALAEAFVLGAAAGIKPETLLEVFSKTGANSYFLKDYMSPRFLASNPGSRGLRWVDTVDA